MHFYLEHNFGHHKNVATPQDPATSRLNQNVYGFWITSVIKQYRNAWQIQLKLLNQHQHSFFSIKNDMLFYHLFQFSYLAIIYAYLGTFVLLCAITVGAISFCFWKPSIISNITACKEKTSLRSLRTRTTHHSWNSNHYIGR